MEKGNEQEKKRTGSFLLIVSIILSVVLLFLVIRRFIGGSASRAVSQETYTDLISAKEIATLSVSEFIYNGIAQAVKENGEIDYNILYRSTVKVSVDANHIAYRLDEAQKTVTFIFPEFTVESPVIDVGSISFIPNRSDLYIDDVIALCRSDAFAEASQSEKLISSARENLQSIIEAWYSPVLEGYTFDYIFSAAEGGESE